MDLLNRVLTLTDHTRLAEQAGSRSTWYKEWYHFCIMGPGIEAVVNFSVMNDNRPSAAPGDRQARLILLVHEGGAWDGDVEEIHTRDVQVQPGRIDLRFGQNTLRYQDGIFRISVVLQNRPLTLDLQVRPVTYPLLRNRAPIGRGAIDWLVAPRLQASGTIVSGRRVHRLENAPAYHDHNWGHWLWGQDFAWEWGFALPIQGSSAWSLVFDRMNNRARTEVQELKLCLWRGERLVRIFANREIDVRIQGYLARGRVPKFPRIMSLIAPEATTDVPRCVEVQAASWSDYMECQFEAEELAQIVVPNETDLGVTVINEALGKIKAEGKVKGESISIEGRGFFEFLT